MLRVDSASRRDWDKVVMMGDSHHFILVKADFADKENIKGQLIFKCKYRAILSVDLDSKEKK